MMPPFILFNIFHPGRIVKSGFKKPGLVAEQPEMLEKEAKEGGEGTVSSAERL